MFSHPRRLVSTALAIVLGVAFVAAALALGRTLTHTFEAQAAGSVRGATVVVSSHGGPGRGPTLSPDFTRRLATLPGVQAVHPDLQVTLTQRLGDARLPVAGIVAPTQDQGPLTQGRLPTGAGEVAVSTVLAESRHVSVGQDVALSSHDGKKQATGRVVGVVALSAAADPGTPAVVADPATLLAWSGAGGYDTVALTAPGVDPHELVTRITALPGASTFVVRTGQQEIDTRVAAATNDTGIITGVILSFAAISVLVSAIVIANTFSILIAQRVRELALLRAVGATRAQVFRSVVKEASALAVVASSVGLVLGLGLVAALSAFSRTTGFALAGLSVDVWTVVVPLLVGVVVTLVSTVVPARRATRVAPVAALRPDVSAPTATRTGRARIVVGAGCAVGGGVALAWAGTTHALGVGLVAGALSVVGVLLLGPVLVPALASVIGAVPARFAGPPTRLAVDNARRNPARAASTASALFIGVTLITLMSVGAATAQASIGRQLDRSMPVDATIGELSGASRAKVLAGARAVSDVQAVTTATTLHLTVDGSNEPVQALALGPGAGDVVRDPRLAAGLTDGVILLDAKAGYPDGATLTVRGGDGPASATTTPVSLRVMVRDDTNATGVITEATAARIRPDTVPDVLVRFRDGVDQTRATERLTASLATDSVIVESSAQRRASLEQGVAILLYIVTGLLGVAVLIALVGVGNTLALSVLERTRENGLLRALGVTRRQIRTMLGVEALTLAGVGVLLGITLGIGYGLAGASTLLGTVEVVPAVPWGRLLVVALVALCAGWLASVLPGRRAARVSPNAALHAD